MTNWFDTFSLRYHLFSFPIHPRHCFHMIMIALFYPSVMLSALWRLGLEVLWQCLFHGPSLQILSCQTRRDMSITFKLCHHPFPEAHEGEELWGKQTVWGSGLFFPVTRTPSQIAGPPVWVYPCCMEVIRLFQHRVILTWPRVILT